MREAVFEKINGLFSSLSQAVFLLDRQGHCLVPRQPDTFMLPASLQENVPVSKSGYLFLTLPGLDALTLAMREGPGGKDLLVLCARLIETFYREEGITHELGNAMRRLAAGELSERELDNLSQDHGIPMALPRAALLVRFEKPLPAMPEEALHEFIPLAEDDLLIPLDSRSLLVARVMAEDGQADLVEYAMALQDTLENELGQTAVIGIGQTADSLAGLHQSLKQADQAIRIGGLFSLKEKIHHYGMLVLERFLLDCAPEEAGHYVELLFNPQTAKLFTDEMLETIHVFFSKDLNLTDAARELYIHRNTLVYRLDKIQKGCGLDLRHFQDAMLFKLLNGLRQRSLDTAPHTEVRFER